MNYEIAKKDDNGIRIETDHISVMIMRYEDETIVAVALKSPGITEKQSIYYRDYEGTRYWHIPDPFSREYARRLFEAGYDPEDEHLDA